LLKAKKEKEKALKLLIQVVGKDKLANHLQTHSGSPDILQSIIGAFGASSFSASRSLNGILTSPNRPVSPGRKQLDRNK